MRIVLAFLCLCSSAHAQLAPPLTDAVCLFRAQNAAPVPNEGSRTEPLSLTNVTFNADATLGNHWTFGATSIGNCPVPAAVLNGDITLALRYRTTALWSDRPLFMIADPDPTYATPIKRIFLHQSSQNKYVSRAWLKPPTNSWVLSQSNTSVSTSRTDTVVMTWSTVDNTNRLYVNGVLESSSSLGAPRTDLTGTGGLEVPTLAASQFTPPAGYVFSIAQWSRTLAPAEVAALTTLPDWLAGGGGSVPPPQLPIVKINGTVQPGATAKVNGVDLDSSSTVEITVP